MMAAGTSSFSFLPQLKKHFNFNLNNRFPCSKFNSNKRMTGQSVSLNTRNYEFSDGVSEVELKIHLRDGQVKSCRDVFVNAEEGATSLTVKVKSPYGPLVTLLETNHLYDKIKPAETIWYIDEDQLVINLKKHDADLKWPDIVESWESLTIGAVRLLKGSSLYIVGESNELNQIVARELAVGLGYTPLNTSELLEAFTKQTIDSWVIAEGMDSVAKAEGAILESLSSHVRAVIATLGGEHGAAFDANKWQHLYSGFTIWLSPSETTDDIRAKEEARRQIENGSGAYSNADVVVKMRGWDHHHAQTVAQACLSALKKLILSDKTLPGKKSLYIRLGCRGDWPNIKPPGWDPSAGASVSQ